MKKLFTGGAIALAAGSALAAILAFEEDLPPSSAFLAACSEAQRLEGMRYGIDRPRAYVPLADVDAAFDAAETLRQSNWPICDRREPN